MPAIRSVVSNSFFQTLRYPKIAPTFTAVAETPGINERALIVWFQSSDHATMPNLILDQKDLDDVVAYILSLRAQK